MKVLENVGDIPVDHPSLKSAALLLKQCGFVFKQFPSSFNITYYIGSDLIHEEVGQGTQHKWRQEDFARMLVNTLAALHRKGRADCIAKLHKFLGEEPGS